MVVNNAGPVRLLINQTHSGNHWLGLQLLNRHGGDAIGARVEIISTDGQRRWRRSRVDGSYASASDPRVLVGLASNNAPLDLRVTWPDGSRERWSRLDADRYHRLQQGHGEPVSTAAP